MNIPLGKPFIGIKEKEAVEKVLYSRHLATGDTVKEFETELARKFQRKYCIAVSSGTAALYLGLKALGIKRVVIPSITCNAVLYAVLNAGASVIFSDVERDTHNLDLSTLSEKQLSSADAVIVTHTYGHAADMDELNNYIRKYNLILVEDFAQATGGYFKDCILGSFGRIAITSFSATKIIAAGQGGILLTDDKSLYLKGGYLRGSRTTDYYKGLIPMNFQMTDIQAAMGLVQLNKLDKMTEMRRIVASRYNQKLGTSSVDIISKKAWAKHVYYKFAIVLPENIKKQVFINRMKEFGIETGKLYDPPLHKTEFARSIVNSKIELPIAEYLASRTVSLPMFPEMSNEEVDKVCKAVSSVSRDLQETR